MSRVHGKSEHLFLAGQVVGPGIYRSEIGAEVVLAEVGCLPAATGRLVRYRQVEGCWPYQPSGGAYHQFIQ